MSPTRNTFKRFFFATLVAVALSFVAHAQAMPELEAHCGMMPPHGRPDMMSPHGEAPLPPFLHRIKLSEAQQDKIFAILHAQVPQMRVQAKTLRKAHDELRELSLSDKYDEDRAKVLADSGAKAMAEMALLRSRTDRQIIALLTSEQRQAVGGKNFR